MSLKSKQRRDAKRKRKNKGGRPAREHRKGLCIYPYSESIFTGQSKQVESRITWGAKPKWVGGSSDHP